MKKIALFHSYYIDYCYINARIKIVCSELKD